MSLKLRLLTPAFLLILACTPKDEADDGDTGASGEETNGGSTTSGDGATSGDSDPTMPGTASNSSVSSGGTDSTTSPGTSASDTEASDEATSAGTVPGTSVATSDDPSDTATDTATDTADPPPPVPCDGDPQPIVAETIMAYTQAQVPPEPDPTSQSGTTVGTDNDPNPPDTLYIKFSDQQYSCADPNALLECGPHWEFTIVVPPEFQFPGLYNLAGNGPFATLSETGKPEGNECSFGGGGGFGGTFELINITAETVEGRLCGVEAFFTESDPDLNGNFVAERCQ